MRSNDIERPRRDLTDWWSDLFGRRIWNWDDTPFALLREGERMLRVEELIDGKELVVRAEMPGIDPEKDVQVHVRNHVLEIRAERKETSEKKENGTTRSEFRYGSFFRSIALPPDAQEHDVHATYNDGILEVRMPLDGKQAEATKVEVKRT
jgi:HSP20 family protein